MGCVELFPDKKCYEGVLFNVISIASRWVGVKFPYKKRYVTLEWPPPPKNTVNDNRKYKE